ncbi:MAG TPA: YiiX/YebB-like N1pC/P60 family cysteine hydrolase [Hyphomicrobiaceae bacterium]|nr:YiiX/YebB-like N1pC/P60 family cysteine hydrolase [Hyphomicrobiaceae bacterium]
MKVKLAGLAVVALGLVTSASEIGAVSPPVSGPGTQPTATAGGDVWPMPIDTFLAGDYLVRADVVLTRRDYDITSYLIRWATGSPFSHAALVFNRPNQEPGIANTFVIEAGTSGVDLTNLRDYISDKSSFIGIKRFKRDWFDESKKARVRGLLLDHIKATYNYWAIGRIVRNVWFGVQHGVGGRERTLERYNEQQWTAPSEFICSGLVQIGFVEMALESIKRGELAPAALNEVVFQERTRKWLPDSNGWRQLGGEAAESAALFRLQNLAALESVTPDDLAKSDKLEWLYLIRGDKVHKVGSYEEVVRLVQAEEGGAAPSQ